MKITQEYLDRHIVIQVAEPFPEDLRELEADFGAGVHVLWDDAKQAIAAFAFEPALFTPEGARSWLKEAQEENRIDAISQDARRDADVSVIVALESRLLDGHSGRGGDLIWKEILHPGTWFKTDSGRRIDVTPDIIKATFDAFKMGLPQYVSVPVDSHHPDSSGVVPPQLNRGFVKDLHLTPDYRLFGAFDLRDPQVKAGVVEGTIADCSVFIQSNVVHNETGERHPWVLRHVLLTNNPLVNGLSGWGELPVSVAADGVEAVMEVQVYQYQTMGDVRDVSVQADYAEEQEKETDGGSDMPTKETDDVQLSDQDLAQLQAFKSLGLTAEDVRAMQERDRAVRQKARALEIESIVNALQGKGAHDQVSCVDGFAHYPVVVQAVATALKELPDALALSADDNGSTPVDTVVMGIVNAIPQEGRLSLNPQPVARKDNSAVAAAGIDGDAPTTPTDDQLDALADVL